MFTLASKKNEIGTKIAKSLLELMFLFRILAGASIRRRFLGSMAAFRPAASPQEKAGTLCSRTRLAPSRRKITGLRAPP
ncbi:MAG TPA: hypothetical protein VLQ65_16760, partial [Saliniramus sp.]|nr:hypothetical protein [Saliniramus sp.]